MADTLVWDVGHWDVDIWGWDAPQPPEPPAPTTYSVDLCAGFVKVGEATAYELSAVVRNLKVGEWQLSAPLAGLECPDVGAVDSIVVYDNNEARIVFAGIVRRCGGVDGGVTRQVTAEGTRFEFRGVDIYGLLATRQVWPDPSGNPPWPVSHDTRTGPGSTVAAQYIAVNAGTGTILTSRIIPGLSVVDPVVGRVGTWNGRLQPLDQFVGRICRETGITCQATMTAPGAFVFSFGTPRDLSNKILLTDQGDLEELSRLVAPAVATFVVAAGQGELTDRQFAVANSGATGLDRVETVYENTNITTADGLAVAVASQLELHGEDISVDGTVADGAAQRIRYLDDYRLGDWLGVEVDGVRYASQVEAVTISLTAARELVRPVLGRASTNEALSLIRDVAGLAARFDSQIA